MGIMLHCSVSWVTLLKIEHCSFQHLKFANFLYALRFLICIEEDIL